MAEVLSIKTGLPLRCRPHIFVRKRESRRRFSRIRPRISLDG